MPNTIESIYKLYTEMTDIMKQQLDGLMKPVIRTEKLSEMLEEDGDGFEHQLQRYNALSLDLALLAQNVDRSVAALEAGELDLLRERASKEIYVMQEIGGQIEKQLLLLQQQSGSMIGRVQQNRTVVRSYGGFDMMDSTPMYFDEKN